MHSNYQTIKVDFHNHIATIRLNRPEIFNAINGVMAKELKQAFDRLSDDDNVKCIILTGEGKAFCSGQDLNEFKDMSELSIQEVLQSRYNPLVMSMHNCPKIIIGKISSHPALVHHGWRKFNDSFECRVPIPDFFFPFEK